MQFVPIHIGINWFPLIKFMVLHLSLNWLMFGHFSYFLPNFSRFHISTQSRWCKIFSVLLQTLKSNAPLRINPPPFHLWSYFVLDPLHSSISFRNLQFRLVSDDNVSWNKKYIFSAVYCRGDLSWRSHFQQCLKISINLVVVTHIHSVETTTNIPLKAFTSRSSSHLPVIHAALFSNLNLPPTHQLLHLPTLVPSVRLKSDTLFEWHVVSSPSPELTWSLFTQLVAANVRTFYCCWVWLHGRY